MQKRWASIKLTLLLLYLGVLPLTPDVPLPFALLAFTLIAAAPLFLKLARILSHRFLTPVQPSIVRSAPSARQLSRRPIAPGTRGTVRSRAPSTLIAAHD